MRARGNTKIILQKVTEIQKLIGQAQAGYDNDGGWNRVDRSSIVKPNLERAHELCVEIRSMYDPI